MSETNQQIGKASDRVHAWLLLSKANRALEAYASRSIQALGMCSSDFAVLELLLHKGPLPVNTVGKRVLLTSGSMTAAIDRLERRGLAERQDNPEDRRARIVHLTSQGRKLIEKLFGEHERDIERAFSCLSNREVADLTHALRKLGRGTEALGEGHSELERK